MNRDELKNAVFAALHLVAPEVEEADIDADAELREECDLDSMDYLNFLEALKKSTGINVPSKDYDRVDTLNKLLDYLQQSGDSSFKPPPL